MLWVLCSNDWIISRDITLQGRDENGCQPAREEELKKFAQEELRDASRVVGSQMGL